MSKKLLSKKQRKVLKRIIIAFIIYVLIIVLEKVTGIDNVMVLGALSLIPYVISGYDVVTKAFRNIKKGKVFDENFLMTLA